ncbi:MAG: hypothetical protein RL240_4217, partial [Planctomycetota bacterium]
KDLERFVEDGTQFRKDRTTANPTSFVVLDFNLRPILDHQTGDS